ncbi:hypothetical protein ACTG9Q_29895 [Actinokineospora sp. 24-640]
MNIGADHDIRVEDRDQGGEVAAAGGGEEGVDHGPLLGQGRVQDRRSPHPAAGAAGQLASGRGRLVDDRGDLRRSVSWH